MIDHHIVFSAPDMKYLIWILLAFSSTAFAGGEYLCHQNLEKEKGDLVFDDSVFYLRVKSDEDGNTICTLGKNGGAWRALKVLGTSYCSITLSKASEMIIATEDDELKLTIDPKFELDQYGRMSNPATAILRFDGSSGSIYRTHHFSCVVPNEEEKNYGEWLQD